MRVQLARSDSGPVQLHADEGWPCNRLAVEIRGSPAHDHVIGVPGMILPPARWQRVFVVALLVLPLLVVVGLSAPGWLVLPLLSEPRRKAVIQLLRCLIDWIKAIAEVAGG